SAARRAGRIVGHPVRGAGVRGTDRTATPDVRRHRRQPAARAEGLMDVLIALAMVAPMVAAAVAGIGGWRRWTATLTVLSCVAVLGAGVALAILTHGSSRIAFGDVLRADALSATMLIVVGVVGTLASWASIGYIDHELAH